MATQLRIDMLDVGAQEYGDATLLELAGRRILIDGAHTTSDRPAPGHPSLQEQIDAATGADAGASNRRHVDLLIVSHPHLDHIGCLPSLIDNGELQVDWALLPDPTLGWPSPPGGQPPSDGVPDTVWRAIAGWREEPRPPFLGDAALSDFLADAAGLEEDYTAMIAALREAGTKVLRFGRDDLGPLLAEFAPLGFDVLGPSADQLALTAFLIAKRTSDAVQTLSDRLARSDAPPTAEQLYRHLIAPPASDSDIARLARPGALVNLQSCVVSFRVTGRRLLFTGDAQLADPETANPQLLAHMRELRAKIKAARPYAFVKLPHHGSPDGLDASVLEEIGRAKLFGFEGGSDGVGHPSRKVLKLLQDLKPPARWVRTDLNGRVTIQPAGSGWQIRPTHGAVSETRVTDPLVPIRSPGAPAVGGAIVAVEPVGAPVAAAANPVAKPLEVERAVESQDVQFTARLPAGATKLIVTIELERGAPTTTSDARVTSVTSRGEGLKIAGGRPLPNLLFVSSAEGLRANISASEADAILGSIDRLYRFLDVGKPSTATEAAGIVTREVVADPEIEGVVIVGGYDVVPSQALDTLPQSHVPLVSRTVDFYDRFVVWSDDLYGYGSPDRPALPVSRVPDARSHVLLRRALAAGAPPFGNRRGLRNIARPFADEIYAMLPGQAAMDRSRDTTAAAVGGSFLGDAVYLMLHGSSSDTSRFWGEREGGYLEAFNTSNVPESTGATVFVGACWGALCVDIPAIWALSGREAAPRMESGSIALSYLARGARAFVGCTGEHYSPPTDPPEDGFGSPMHRAFWSAVAAGQPPARALATAKQAYLAGIPTRQQDPADQAIEYKILRQFTCLGLGW